MTAKKLKKTNRQKTQTDKKDKQTKIQKFKKTNKIYILYCDVGPVSHSYIFPPNVSNIWQTLFLWEKINIYENITQTNHVGQKP